VLFAFLCVACLAASAGGYLYVSRGEQVDETPVTPSDVTLASTPGVTSTAQIGEIVSPPTARPTSTPAPSPTAVPARLSDAAASNYATLLTLEGSIFALEYIVGEVETNKMSETEATDFILAVDRVFSTLETSFSEPLPAETNPALVQAWTEALNAFAAIDDLALIWQRGDVTTEEVKTTLIPVREQVATSIAMAETALEEEHGVSLTQIRPERTEEVRTEVMASMIAFVESQEQTTSSAAAPISFDFADTDIPLSDTLFSSKAWTYAGRIVQLSGNFSDAVITLDELIQKDAQVVAGNRNQEIAFTIATIHASSRIIKETELPARLSSTRDLLLTALHDCDTAALYLTSGLTNPTNFPVGQKYLETCNEKLAQPLEELNAFISGNQTPAEVAVEAQAVSGCPNGCTEIQPGCIIKGDVDELGGRVYYLPGNSLYGTISIEPDKNERWFCNITEAVSNGWQQPATS